MGGGKEDEVKIKWWEGRRESGRKGRLVKLHGRGEGGEGKGIG